MTLKIDTTERDMIARGDRIGADLARALLRFYDYHSALPASEVGELEEAVRLAEVGEYLYNARAYSYGDGYTEPREYGIEWQWQQSNPNEYGQGQLLKEAVEWHAGQASDGVITEAAKLRSALTSQSARIAALEDALDLLIDNNRKGVTGAQARQTWMNARALSRRAITGGGDE